MGKFGIIEGGGNREYGNAIMAQQAFGDLLIEIVRALSRGNDDAGKIAAALVGFVDKMQVTEIPLWKVIADEVREIHTTNLGYGAPDLHTSFELRQVVSSSLRMAADLISNDGFAKARLSKSQDSLNKAIKNKVRESERRSRQNGWSYVEDIVATVPPIKGSTTRGKRKKSAPENAEDYLMRLD